MTVMEPQEKTVETGSVMSGAAVQVASLRSAQAGLAAVLTWAGGGAFWWVVAASLGLIASIKFHGPGFLADIPALTYGRVRIAATQVGWWGGVVSVLLGAALGWLGRGSPAGVGFPGLAVLGGLLWHLGLLTACIALLAGQTTGYDGWGMPTPAAWVCAAGLLLLGVSWASTLHRRSARSLQPAHWFLWTGFLWLAWSASTAFVLLGLHRVRGVMQAVVDGWFLANVQQVAGTLLGLGLLYGWVSTWTQRPLYSRYLALLTFGGLLAFASWTGVAPSAPVPAWLPVLSTVAVVLCVVPWLAAGLNWYRSTVGCRERFWADPAGRFAAVAHGAFLIGAAMKLGLHVPGLYPVLEFTWWESARHWVHVWGFLGLAGMAALDAWMRHTAELAGWERWARVQFWCLVTGMGLAGLALAVAGVVQGLAWGDPAISNVEVLQRTLMWLRLGTVGELLWWVGSLMFWLNLVLVTLRCGLTWWRNWWAQVTAPVRAQEAAA